MRQKAKAQTANPKEGKSNEPKEVKLSVGSTSLEATFEEKRSNDFHVIVLQAGVKTYDRYGTVRCPGVENLHDLTSGSKDKLRTISVGMSEFTLTSDSFPYFDV